MTLSLQTKISDAGIECSYEDGTYAGTIVYKTGNAAAGYPLPTWIAKPASPFDLGSYRFLSREAAEFYILAMAIEAKTAKES